MNIIFLEPSEKELDNGINYYEDQSDGLGTRFYDEVMYFIKLIQMSPSSWSKVGKRTRKCILNKFPYFILYIAEGNDLFITAIGHQHRSPKCFANRIQ